MAQRVEDFRNPKGALDYEMVGGHWLQVTDVKTPSGGVAGLRVDITARKQTEAAPRESQERFSDFAKSSSDFFWETDAESPSSMRKGLSRATAPRSPM